MRSVVVLALCILALVGSAGAADCPGTLLYDQVIDPATFWPGISGAGSVVLETGVFVEPSTGYAWFLFNTPFSLAVFDPGVAFSGSTPTALAAFQDQDITVYPAGMYFPELNSPQNIIVDEGNDQIIITAEATVGSSNVTGIYFLRRSTFLNGGNSGSPSVIEFVRPPIKMEPNPRGLVFDPSGDGSFFASALNNISKIDASGNLLFSNTASPAGTYHWALAIDDESSLLWATTYAQTVFYAYTITATSVTPFTSLLLGQEARGLAYHPQFKELYAVKRSSGFVRVKPYNSGFALSPFGGDFSRSNGLAIDVSRGWVYITHTENETYAVTDHIQIFKYQHTGCQCQTVSDCDANEICHIGICVTSACQPTCQVGQPDGTCSASTCSSSVVDPVLYPSQLNFSSASPQFGIIPDGDTSKEVFILFESLDEIPPGGGLPNQLVNLLTQTYTLTGPVQNAISQDFTITTTATNPKLTWNYSLLAANASTQHTFGTALLDQSGEQTKWTFQMQDWPWQSTTNSLNLRVRIWTDYGAFTSSSSQVNLDGTTSYFLSNGQVQVTVSLINFAIVNGTTQVPITSSFLTDNSVLLLNFPYFSSTMEYDPNFGVLVTPQDNSGGGPDTVLVIVLSVVIPSVVVPILVLLAVLVTVYVVYYFRRRTMVHARDSINTDSFEYAAAAVDEEEH